MTGVVCRAGGPVAVNNVGLSLEACTTAVPCLVYSIPMGGSMLIGLSVTQTLNY